MHICFIYFCGKFGVDQRQCGLGNWRFCAFALLQGNADLTSPRVDRIAQIRSK
jgi:hypothetical protein